MIIQDSWEPMMHPREVEFVEQFLKPEHHVLEWGIGGTTLKFAPQVKHYYGIDHHKEWYDAVLDQINKAKLTNVSTILQDGPQFVTCVHEFNQPKFDVVLVDGRDYRVECAVYALNYIDKDSIILIHDFYPRKGQYGAVLKYYNEIGGIKDTEQTIIALKRQ